MLASCVLAYPVYIDLFREIKLLVRVLDFTTRLWRMRRGGGSANTVSLLMTTTNLDCILEFYSDFSWEYTLWSLIRYVKTQNSRLFINSILQLYRRLCVNRVCILRYFQTCSSPTHTITLSDSSGCRVVAVCQWFDTMEINLYIVIVIIIIILSFPCIV